MNPNSEPNKYQDVDLSKFTPISQSVVSEINNSQNFSDLEDLSSFERFIIQHSGGIVQSAKGAHVALLGAIIISVIITLWLFVSNGTSNESDVLEIKKYSEQRQFLPY